MAVGFSGVAGARSRRYAEYMTTIEEIEQALRRMSPEEVAIFRDWFARFDAESWIGS